MTRFFRPPALSSAVALALGIALGACSRTGSSGAAGSGPSASSAAAARAAGSGTASSSLEPPAAGEEQAVREIFLQYRDAIAKGRGETAASLASEKTLAYFERMRLAALTMPAAEVKHSPVMDRTMILLTRARIAKEDLERWHGRELFVHAVDQGWVGKEAQRLEPDVVSIEGGTASLGLRSGTSVVTPAQGFRLYQEGGGWKLDVISVARADSASMKAVEKELAQIDPDPNRALEKVVEKVTGKPVSAEIWQPLVRQP
jgi:hypothetical protein